MNLPVFALKSYQTHMLAALRKYLAKTVELNNADDAFYSVTKRLFDT